MPDALSITASSRRSRTADAAVVDARSPSGRAATSSSCPRASPATSCASRTSPDASSPSRRRPRRWPAASTTCSATSRRLDAPCVERVAVIAGRTDAAGEPLPAALVTAHLKFSLPYRALFTQVLRPDTATRLVDALAVLLVRLHNVGFFWGDVSLSNTLFRRDAGAFAAYLVDAETGELHESGLTPRSARARPRRRAHQHRRRDHGPRGRRPPRGRRRRHRDRRRHRVVVPLAVGGAHRPARRSRPTRRGGSPSGCSGSTTSASTSARCRSRRRPTAPASRSSRRSSMPATTSAASSA